ncbi:glycosyltransferase family 2 protein [Acinetobacter sp. MD2]|nr:glycosyltransferase family 2 protein [Acinetobacter sp. MD2]
MLISIGMITFNNPKEEIFKCLNSIRYQTYSNEKIEIIIRNQGLSETINYIKEYLSQHKNIKITVYQGENIGFGRGHNDIFSKISNESSAYLCLNPDGVLHNETIEKLVNRAIKNDWNGIFEAIQEPIMHPKKYNPNTGNTEWCSGACLLIPNDIYKKISGFDEDFFLYCEDVDLSWRVKSHGYQCITCPDALFFHYAVDRKSREIEIWRSALLLAHKWRAEAFKTFALNNLLSLVDINKKDILENISKYSEHPLDDVYKANPNFKHGLTFSEKMWN